MTPWRARVKQRCLRFLTWSHHRSVRLAAGAFKWKLTEMPVAMRKKKPSS